MAFVKLDCSMLHSSIWPDKIARDIFITALLMAEPFELRKSVKQISAVCLEETGWEIPPGWYGLVRAAGTGIVHMAGVERDQGLAALVRLSSPEAESRNPANQGRRIARIDGGYLILNFFVYRDRDHTAADRMKRLRERRKVSETSSEQLRVTRDKSESKLRNVTQAEAEAESESAAAAGVLKSLEEAGIGEPTRSELIDTPGVTAAMVEKINSRALKNRKGTGAVVNDIRDSAALAVRRLRKAEENEKKKAQESDAKKEMENAERAAVEESEAQTNAALDGLDDIRLAALKKQAIDAHPGMKIFLAGNVRTSLPLRHCMAEILRQGVGSNGHASNH